MKKFFVLAALVISLLVPSLVCNAAAGEVIYSGNSGDFIFEPGTDYSPTDLFPDLKDVMPGDILTQKITVRNNADNKVNVEIFMQALGAADKESVDFLSQLGLLVTKSGDDIVFDDMADQPMRLLEPVSLGVFGPGETVDLDVKLVVPGELDNRYQSKIGRLDWQFSVQETAAEISRPGPADPSKQPVEPSRPSSDTPSVPDGPSGQQSTVYSTPTPTASVGGTTTVVPGGKPGGSEQPLNPTQTGDAAVFIIYLVIMVAAMGGVVLAARKKKNDEDQ